MMGLISTLLRHRAYANAWWHVALATSKSFISHRSISENASLFELSKLLVKSWISNTSLSSSVVKDGFLSKQPSNSSPQSLQERHNSGLLHGFMEKFGTLKRRFTTSILHWKSSNLTQANVKILKSFGKRVGRGQKDTELQDGGFWVYYVLNMHVKN